MTKEEVLIWLTQLGRDWVGLHEAYETYNGKDRPLEFWDNILKWHDTAFITKRYNQYVWEKYREFNSIEQYRLTRKALELLTST